LQADLGAAQIRSADGGASESNQRKSLQLRGAAIYCRAICLHFSAEPGEVRPPQFDSVVRRLPTVAVIAKLRCRYAMRSSLARISAGQSSQGARGSTQSVAVLAGLQSAPRRRTDSTHDSSRVPENSIDLLPQQGSDDFLDRLSSAQFARRLWAYSHRPLLKQLAEEGDIYRQIR
jgi:hypothetical protein